MILEKYEKQPREFKDYDIDYTVWLSNDPLDSLSNVEVTVLCEDDPLDVSLTVSPVQITTNTAKLWVLGGTSGRKYKLTIVATTTVGRIDECELIFKVKDK